MLPEHLDLMRIIEASGVADPLVLEAMRRVERHRFVPTASGFAAYDDRPLPIGHGQTISQPSLVARMTELLGLTGGERVLEIGSGCGYQAAILGCIAREVVGIEILPALVELANRTLAELGVANVEIRAGDGWGGAPDRQPFAGIILSCGAPVVPPHLVEQLEEGGCLVGPIGRDPGHCWLQKVIRRGKTLNVEKVVAVRFVPMVGEALKHQSEADPGDRSDSWWW